MKTRAIGILYLSICLARPILDILRVCKYFGYSLSELTVLFDSLIMSLFLYALEVWACAH